MIAILEDKPGSWGMGGRGTRHRRERMSALPFIVRSQLFTLGRHLRYVYSPRYCKLRESAPAA
jgi:hypothetical protein